MINFQYANEPIIDYNFNDKQIKDFNKNIKIILNDLNNTKKAYLFQNNNKDFPKNPINKALFNLKDLIMETPTFGNNNCDLKPQQYLYNDDGYTGFVFSKDDNILKMWACGAFDKQMHTNIPTGELYLSFLCGQGGAGLIFDLIKEIIENGGRNKMVNFSDIQYLDLTALPSYKTLNFYNKKDGLVPSEEIFDNKNNSGYNNYMINLAKIILFLINSPEYKKIIKNLDQETIDDFWSNYVESHLKFIDFVFFYNTPKSMKIKNEFGTHFNQLIPSEDLKNTINSFDNDKTNKKMFKKLIEEFNKNKKEILDINKKLFNNNIRSKEDYETIKELISNVTDKNIFELEETINYINENY